MSNTWPCYRKECVGGSSRGFAVCYVACPRRECNRPFNLAFDAFMNANDSQRTRIPASWEDTGDAENGPHLTGCAAHDLYLLDDVEYAVFEDGTAERCETFDTQGIECDNHVR